MAIPPVVERIARGIWRSPKLPWLSLERQNSKKMGKALLVLKRTCSCRVGWGEVCKPEHPGSCMGALMCYRYVLWRAIESHSQRLGEIREVVSRPVPPPHLADRNPFHRFLGNAENAECKLPSIQQQSFRSSLVI